MVSSSKNGGSGELSVFQKVWNQMKYILWIKNEKKRGNLVKKIVKTELLEMILSKGCEILTISNLGANELLAMMEGNIRVGPFF